MPNMTEFKGDRVRNHRDIPAISAWGKGSFCPWVYYHLLRVEASVPVTEYVAYVTHLSINTNKFGRVAAKILGVEVYMPRVFPRLEGTRGFQICAPFAQKATP